MLYAEGSGANVDLYLDNVGAAAIWPVARLENPKRAVPGWRDGGPP